MNSLEIIDSSGEMLTIVESPFSLSKEGKVGFHKDSAERQRFCFFSFPRSPGEGPAF